MDGGNGSATLSADCLVDLDLGNVEEYSGWTVSTGTNGLLVVPAGFNVSTGLAGVTTAGLGVHVQGTTLTVPAGMGFSGIGSIAIRSFAGHDRNRIEQRRVEPDQRAVFIRQRQRQPGQRKPHGQRRRLRHQRRHTYGHKPVRRQRRNRHVYSFCRVPTRSRHSTSVTIRPTAEPIRSVARASCPFRAASTSATPARAVSASRAGQTSLPITSTWATTPLPSGHTISAAGLSGYSEYVGAGGQATFTQSGGTNSATYSLWIGNNSTGSGTYNLTAGNLSASSVAKSSAGWAPALSINRVERTPSPVSSTSASTAPALTR